MLHRIVGCIEGILSYAFLPLRHSTAVILRSLNVKGVCAREDVDKYYNFKKTVDNGVVVFNHPTFFDHIVIMKELDDTLRFVMFDDYLVWPLRWIAKKTRAIVIKNHTKGSAKVVAKEIEQRNVGDPLVITSPTAGKASHTRPWFLYPFKTGAFLTKPKVLPIIIYYHPYQPRANKTIAEEVTSRLKGDELNYVMRVLDPLDSIDNETAQQYAERCRKYMMKELLELQKETQTPPSTEPSLGSIDSLLSSHLFLLCGIAAITNHLLLYGLGMCVVFMTSWMYHGTGCMIWRRIDIASNLIMIGVFGILLLKSRQYKPITMLVLAAIAYALQLPHSIFVHIPIAIGFASIRP